VRIDGRLCLKESATEVTFAIHVVPRASRNEIAGVEGEALRVRLTAPPVEGAANAALIAFLAEVLGVPRRDVRLVSGQTSRHKVVAVVGLRAEVVQERLARAKKDTLSRKQEAGSKRQEAGSRNGDEVRTTKNK
jgi:uncharacterized protein (TIGR00251 family)